MSTIYPIRSGAICVTVRDSYERALKTLKHKVHREKKFVELKKRREYTPPTMERKLQKEQRSRVLWRAQQLRSRSGA
jgi:ribosomal protein S21